MLQQGRTALSSGLIADPSAIKVLASPVRQEVIDTIEALGGVATIAELAEQLGRPTDGLYYHVEMLRRSGLLIAEVGGRSRAGRSERRYRTCARSGRKLGLVYQPHDPRNAAAVRGVVGSMLRIARRDFDRALVPGAVATGPRRELWAGRATGWVSDADLTAINRLLLQLTDRLRRPRGGRRQRLVSLCFVLAPMAPRPTRRPSAAAAPLPARRPAAAAAPLPARRPRHRRTRARASRPR